MPFIDPFLNKITMYRLMFQGLVILAILAIALAFLHIISWSGLSLIELLALITLSCFVSDRVFGFLFKSARNYESVWITAFILFFILTPIMSLGDVWITLGAGVLATASKYILAIHKRHIFNPAGVAVVILSVVGIGSASWWIGTPVMFIPVLILGLLIVRKIRRFDLFFAFVIAQTVTSLALTLATGLPVAATFVQNWLSWPTLFFGAVMLVEPFTTPPTRPLRIVYGALTGVVFAIPFHIPLIVLTIYSSPQLALIIGNIFSYIVSSKQRIILTLTSKQKISASVDEFVFTADQKPRFTPGQYMEWTLPHKKTDPRGNRRYFTIASAPEDDDVRLGMRIGDTSSSFKKALEAMPMGGTVSAAGIAGEFMLPEDLSRKTLCIAGGIGITPFVSMMRSMIKRGERRDMVLLYSCNTEAEFAFQDVIEKAALLGVQVIFIAGKVITKELLANEVTDYKERTWYLSGPQGMVQAYVRLGLSLGMHRTSLKTDYFPGL